MSFVSKLKDLQDHLMKCLGTKVDIVSDFEGSGELIQQGQPSVWLTPYGAKKIDDKRSNCGSVFRCSVVITAVYYCPTPTVGGVISRGYDCELPLCGPLIEGDDFQCKIFDCLKEFNCEKDVDFKGKYEVYTITELFKPIFKNGCVLLRSLWERDIVINY